ncbi:hypothetical protein ACKVWC_008631 [Pyricularia oryzae]
MPGPMPNRKRKYGAADTSTRSAAAPTKYDLENSESIRDRAKPYLLAVAQMPLDVLDTTWSVGRNRSLDPAHVRVSKETFAKTGVERRSHQHRLQILCSADQVRRTAARQAGPDKDGILSFINCADINDDVEVMAGQYRIRALQEIVAESNAPAGQSWWICEFYDKGEKIIPPAGDVRPPAVKSEARRLVTPRP